MVHYLGDVDDLVVVVVVVVVVDSRDDVVQLRHVGAAVNTRKRLLNTPLIQKMGESGLTCLLIRPRLRLLMLRWLVLLEVVVLRPWN